MRLPRTRWATAPAALRTTVPFVDAASSTHTPPLAGPSLRWVREIEFVGSGMTNRRSPLVPVGSRPTTRTESTFSRWPESTTSQACTVPGSPVGPVAGAGEGFGGVGGGWRGPAWCQGVGLCVPGRYCRGRFPGSGPAWRQGTGRGDGRRGRYRGAWHRETRVLLPPGKRFLGFFIPVPGTGAGFLGPQIEHRGSGDPVHQIPAVAAEETDDQRTHNGHVQQDHQRGTHQLPFQARGVIAAVGDGDRSGEQRARGASGTGAQQGEDGDQLHDCDARQHRGVQEPPERAGHRHDAGQIRQVGQRAGQPAGRDREVVVLFGLHRFGARHRGTWFRPGAGGERSGRAGS